MKQQWIRLVLLPMLLLTLSAGEAEAKLNVLTTHALLKSRAEEVGGEDISVSCLATGLEDPHAVSAKPSYMVSARRADLFIKVGMDLEIGYEQLVVEGSRNPKIHFGQIGYLDTSLNALRLEVPDVKVDRSMGDVHPYGNPHYWMDPYNARIIAGTISERLAMLDPANAAAYASRCADFVRRLDAAMFGQALVDRMGGDRLWSLILARRLERYLENQKDADLAGGWYQQARPLRGKRIITYHRSWTYFVERFGMEVVAELEPKPGIPPSPGHLRHVVEAAKMQQVKLILMEPYYNRKAADFVADKVGAAVVVAANAPGGQPQVHDYISLIDNVLHRLLDVYAKAE